MEKLNRCHMTYIVHWCVHGLIHLNCWCGGCKQFIAFQLILHLSADLYVNLNLSNDVKHICFQPVACFLFFFYKRWLT